MTHDFYSLVSIITHWIQEKYDAVIHQDEHYHFAYLIQDLETENNI